MHDDLTAEERTWCRDRAQAMTGTRPLDQRVLQALLDAFSRGKVAGVRKAKATENAIRECELEAKLKLVGEESLHHNGRLITENQALEARVAVLQKANLALDIAYKADLKRYVDVIEQARAVLAKR